MVDFRSSGGSLGVYAKTKSLSSPASSSLDKPAGTLSSVNAQTVGQYAQPLEELKIALKEQKLSPAQTSTTLSSELIKSDIVASASVPVTTALKEKFVSQTTPEQAQKLGYDISSPASKGIDTESSLTIPLFIGAGVLILSRFFK